MDLLMLLGARVREARAARAWSQAELAKRSGLSLRFIADLEHGKGNISVLRLAEVAGALGVPLVRFFEPERRHVALVGLRGAGKTTVGLALAERLDRVFVDVDTAIEERAGLRLGEIFEFHGAAHYRALEREMLRELLEGQEPRVLATGGSVVTDAESWTLLRERAHTVWLRASPNTHLSRVEAQGDFRPMRGRRNALQELRQILADREPLYAQAELSVDTERHGVEAAVDVIVRRL
jgi:XRE family transcriptional regulator, aerobic/anaerobic benzoate catabolism transcriptional regulator